MFGHLAAVLEQLSDRLRREADGSIAPIFAVTLLPVMLATGAAIDYSRASSFKAALQAALDAAVIAGAKNGSSNWSQVALETFTGNFASKYGSASAPTLARDSAEVYTGSVAGTVPTVALGIMRIMSVDVSARATAKAADSDDSCILALDHGQPSSHVSLSLNGAPVVNLSGCSIRSNTSIDCNGHDGSETRAIAGGSTSGCARPRSSAPIVPDIYASLAGNIATACGTSRPGLTWVPGVLPSGAGIVTISKGSYTEHHVCGDLTLSGAGYLTGTTPGSDTVIVIENGKLNIANGSSVQALRTAVVLTGSNSYPSSIDFPTGNGQAAALTLSAPTTQGNPWQGVALYQDPKLTYQVDNRWGPGATFNADGLVYLGKSNVVTDGNTSSSNAKCSKFVMNSFTTNGRVDLNLQQGVDACASIGLKQWGGIIVHLIN